MVPSSIRGKLAGLRYRERLLTLVWGAACWLAVVIAMLLLACFVDWLIDRWQDTPLLVRVGLVLVQLAAAALAAFLFILWPQLRWLPDDELALWVEEKMAQFDHRLISAVQLNQPDADRGGMSAELIAIVTREAEEHSRGRGFAGVADHRRLKRSAFVLAPALLLVLVPLAIWPGVMSALLARQALLPIEIPHSVQLVSVSPEVWLMNETLPLRFRVSGEWDEEMVGTVRVTPEGQPTDTYPLHFIKREGDDAIFGVDAYPTPFNIRYSARLSDGRTKRPSDMILVPRPVVDQLNVWLKLPAYCDSRPIKDKVRYEVPVSGDVVGLKGSRVRVQAMASGEIASARIELLAPEIADPKASADDEAPVVRETIQGKPIAMTVAADGLSAEGSFDLAEGLTAYRVVIEDRHGFPNDPAPRRMLRLVPEAPPTVNLLRDTFGLGNAFDVEGLPVLIGENIRIPYWCFHEYGLGKAQLWYRVLKKHESGNDPPEESPFTRLKLNEATPDESAGDFDPKTGVFENTPYDKAVGFYAVPSRDPDHKLGRQLGGGRAFLKTDGLIDSQGKPIQLKPGDQIEYYVEVFVGDREPIGSTPAVRSESRVSAVVDQKGLAAWLKEVSDEDERVKQLRNKQKSVFDK